MGREYRSAISPNNVPDPGPESLMTAVVERAIFDWRNKPKLAHEFAFGYGFNSLEEELHAFFTSDHYRNMMDLLDCSHMDIPHLLRREGT